METETLALEDLGPAHVEAMVAGQPEPTLPDEVVQGLALEIVEPGLLLGEAACEAVLTGVVMVRGQVPAALGPSVERHRAASRSTWSGG